VVGVTGDLVAGGHAASLARPGGNITGFVDTSPDLSGKRLEILKEVHPKATRIAVVWNGANRIKMLDFKETEAAAHAFGLKLESLDVKGPDPMETKLRVVTKQRVSAILVLQDALTIGNAKKIVDFARTNHLPTMYGSTEFVDAGGLMSYAANFPDLFRRSAVYVDKILKGSNAGDLPVQQPTKFEFVIDLNAAKQIRLTIPPNVLARADKVVR
jgi:putative ABC transport system substrate-binding protein